MGARLTNNNDSYGITLSKAGYAVRVKIDIKETSYKWFGFVAYGGKIQAYNAARIHRDKQLKRGRVPPGRLRTFPNMGVQLAHNRRTIDGETREYTTFRVTIKHPDTGRTLVKTYSPKKWGFLRALDLAIDQRLTWEKDYYGAVVSERALLKAKFE
ncbi:MAG: hypothetical protein OEW37_00040 [Rhodospirillaceae bacterium]|nr:hypothetical protein [Rhodospirillaceae bacterium]